MFPLSAKIVKTISRWPFALKFSLKRFLFTFLFLFYFKFKHLSIKRKCIRKIMKGAGVFLVFVDAEKHKKADLLIKKLN